MSDFEFDLIDFEFDLIDWDLDDYRYEEDSYSDYDAWEAGVYEGSCDPCKSGWFDDEEDDLSWPEPDWDEIEREFQEELQFNPRIGIDCSNIQSGKLESFIEGNNKFKRFDPEFGRNDITEAFHWWDEKELHKFACNKGYMNAHKKVHGIIAKYDTYHTSAIIDKLKSHIEYKKTRQFKNIADGVIEHMLNPSLQYAWDLDPYAVQEHGFLYQPGKPVGYYFPYADFKEYSVELKQRAVDLLGWIHGVSVYSDDELLTIKILRGRSKKAKYITMSIYDLYCNKSHNEKLSEIEHSILEELL